MAFARTIGVKIFAIALLLSAIMIAVAGWSTLKVNQVNREVRTIARGFVPLNDRVNDVEEEVLGQEIHLERLYRLFQQRPRDQAAITAEAARFDARSQRIAAILDEAVRDTATGLRTAVSETHRLEFARLQPMLETIALQHRHFHEQAKAVLHALADDKAELAATLATFLTRERDEFGAATDRLQLEVANFTEGAAAEAGRHERQALRANGIATGFSILLGLVLTFFVTRGLVRPVHRLLSGTKAVELGQFDTEVPVTSSDEIGALTRAFNGMVLELRAKERIQATFGQYVDPRVVAGLIEGASAPASTGEKQIVTVFFSDIAGFTTISERLTPGGLVTLINEYFTLMSAAVRAQNGLIDKYIGDSVMAFWAPPFAAPGTQAEQGCLAALAQFAALGQFRQRLPDLMGMRKGLPEVDIRVGLATGDAIVGSIGSDVAKSYTVMGDTVNLGSRLESVNKVYGTHILACAGTRAMAGDAIEFREIDAITVVGKNEPVRIYEVLAAAGGLTPELAAARERYEAGLAAYRARDWDAAAAAMTEVLERRADDAPARLFLERIAALKLSPPPADWDGVWHLTKK